MGRQVHIYIYLDKDEKNQRWNKIRSFVEDCQKTFIQYLEIALVLFHVLLTIFPGEEPVLLDLDMSVVCQHTHDFQELDLPGQFLNLLLL